MRFNIIVLFCAFLTACLAQSSTNVQQNPTRPNQQTQIPIRPNQQQMPNQQTQIPTRPNQQQMPNQPIQIPTRPNQRMPNQQTQNPTQIPIRPNQQQMPNQPTQIPSRPIPQFQPQALSTPSVSSPEIAIQSVPSQTRRNEQQNEDEGTISDSLVPEDLAPEDLAPEDLAPEDLALEDPAPEDLAPEVSRDMAMDECSPEFYRTEVDALENSITGGVGMIVADVEEGDLLRLTTAYNDTWTAGPCPRTSNAEGLTRSSAWCREHLGRCSQPSDAVCYDYGLFTFEGVTLPFGTLVGRIGTGGFFKVGLGADIMATNSGELELYFWDDDRNNNDGSIVVYTQLIMEGCA